MPLWKLLPSPALVILPKVEVWHKQGMVCALHLTCMSVFTGKAWQWLSAETSPKRSFSLNQRPLPPEQLQPSRTPCAVMALCHSAVPGDGKSHPLCSSTAASCHALTTTYPSLPPLLPDPLLKASGKEIFNRSSCSPGRALFAVCLLFSAFLKAFLQVSDCFCFC